MKNTGFAIRLFFLSCILLPAGRSFARSDGSNGSNDSSKPLNVLIIGDSISIGYTPTVSEALLGTAQVVHNNGNAQDTRNALKKINQWLGNQKWDVIHFNWGLWDLSRKHGDLSVPLDEYRQNLRFLVGQLKKTGAILIFATTTPVPNQNNQARRDADVQTYNAAAREIMAEQNITVNDLYKLAKPNLDDWQRKNNVHFTEEGYRELGLQVAEKIR